MSTWSVPFGRMIAMASGRCRGNACSHSSQFKEPQLVHYGSYDAKFLKKMQQRYPELPSHKEQVRYTNCNQLSILQAYCMRAFTFRPIQTASKMSHVISDSNGHDVKHQGV